MCAVNNPKLENTAPQQQDDADPAQTHAVPHLKGVIGSPQTGYRGLIHLLLDADTLLPTPKGSISKNITSCNCGTSRAVAAVARDILQLWRHNLYKITNHMLRGSTTNNNERHEDSTAAPAPIFNFPGFIKLCLEDDDFMQRVSACCSAVEIRGLLKEMRDNGALEEVAAVYSGGVGGEGGRGELALAVLVSAVGSKRKREEQNEDVGGDGDGVEQQHVEKRDPSLPSHEIDEAVAALCFLSSQQPAKAVTTTTDKNMSTKASSSSSHPTKRKHTPSHVRTALARHVLPLWLRYGHRSPRHKRSSKWKVPWALETIDEESMVQEEQNSSSDNRAPHHRDTTTAVDKLHNTKNNNVNQNDKDAATVSTIINKTGNTSPVDDASSHHDGPAVPAASMVDGFITDTATKNNNNNTLVYNTAALNVPLTSQLTLLSAFPSPYFTPISFPAAAATAAAFEVINHSQAVANAAALAHHHQQQQQQQSMQFAALANTIVQQQQNANRAALPFSPFPPGYFTSARNTPPSSPLVLNPALRPFPFFVGNNINTTQQQKQQQPEAVKKVQVAQAPPTAVVSLHQQQPTAAPYSPAASFAAPMNTYNSSNAQKQVEKPAAKRQKRGGGGSSSGGKANTNVSRNIAILKPIVTSGQRM